MRTAVALALVALAGAARADEVVVESVGFRIITPEGWKPSPDTAAPVVKGLQDADHDSGGLAWVGKSGALFVLWRSTRQPIPGDPVAAVDVALDAFERRAGTVLRTSRAIGAWDATAFVDVEPERGTLILARTTVFLGKSGRLREIRAECVVRKERLEETRKTCETALASFALTVEDADLSPIRAPDAGPTPPPPAAPPPPPKSTAAPPPPTPPAVGEARPWWAGPGVVLVVLLLPVLAFFGYRLLKEFRK